LKAGHPRCLTLPALRPRAHPKRSSDGRYGLFVRWKPAGILRRHGLLTDPHRELTTAAHNEFGFNPGLRFDERSHTGRAGQVVSNLAVTNADALHEILLQYADDEIRARRRPRPDHIAAEAMLGHDRSESGSVLYPFLCHLQMNRRV
jgi:hypothetical protein